MTKTPIATPSGALTGTTQPRPLDWSPSLGPFPNHDDIAPRRTLLINLFGGPGTGKSTNAALVFGKLKTHYYRAELVHEFAKDLNWEERHAALGFQPYIMGKQSWHLERVMGKVDVIVTDSPILLGVVYQGGGYTTGLGHHLWELHRGWRNLNIFLERNEVAHPYVAEGRSQSLAEAQKIDERILHLLEYYREPVARVRVQEGEATANEIVDMAIMVLDHSPKGGDACGD